MDDENEIAIVGIGCRFPGADNLDEFWQVLVNGENHVVEIPKDRWNNDAFYSEDKDADGKHYVKRAGLLKNHDEWDHRFFGVSESEAERIDPQQRYVLECTHMAMEDGGITRADLKNSQTGVYIGVMNDDFKSLSQRDHTEVSNYCATGKSTTIIASRVSYTYDLRGPCMVVDTACSSAMTAIHLGSQALKTGECSMAICGGVSSIVSPDIFVELCKARMMSAVGQCQTFCDTADGYARGEGCGIVMLKTVKMAIKDGNKIWAILRIGSNQDGHATSPITAPSGEQQEALLRQVYTQYGVDPTTLQYVETHGTGTPIGDPTEVNALGRFIATYRRKESKTGFFEKSHLLHHQNEESPDGEKDVHTNNQIIKIGSVKTNIGHTESAAGVASLIKVLLMMKNGKLVPSLHLKKDKSNLNQKIQLDKYCLDVTLKVEDWVPNRYGDRISCVNSFGFGGSNSHAIIIQRKFPPSSRPLINPKHPYLVLCLSAMDKLAFRNTLERFGEDILKTKVSLSDTAYTAAFRRDHFTHRTIIHGQNQHDLQDQLLLKLKNLENIKTQTKTRLIFVFCGVGTTWNGMCSEMMKTQPVFRAKIEEIDSYLEPLSGWRIADKFDCGTTDYSDPFLNHIAIFCVQVALSSLWEHWGVVPHVIVGQSVGEVAAAVASASLSLKDGVSVIYHRSKILSQRTGGKMMVVGNVPIEDIETICERYENKVTIAVYNSPLSCTLSGDAGVMGKIQSELEEMNEKDNASTLIRPLSVQCAYHSHHVAQCMHSIETQLKDLSKGMRKIDHISTVTEDLADNDEFQTGKYWAANIRQPVKFMQAIRKASRPNTTNIFVEVGPRQVLRAHLTHIMTDKLVGECLPSMNAKKENVSMYNSLSTLYEMGVSINWNNIVPTTGVVETVPRYVFNKKKILHITEKNRNFLQGSASTVNAHMYVKPNSSKGTEFRIVVDKETTPFVYDHLLQGAVLIPGAIYVEAAFEIGRTITKYRAYELSVSVEFVNPLTPADDKTYTINVDVEATDNGYKYRAYYKDGRTLCLASFSERQEQERASIDIGAIRDRCKSCMSKGESYMTLEKLGFKYGETLSLIKQSWTSSTECIVEIAVPECIAPQTKTTCLHPSVIDTMFQTFGIISTSGVSEEPTLPKGVGSIVVNRPPQEKMFCYSKLCKKTADGNHYNCILLSPDGYVIAEIQDFYTKTVRVSETVTQRFLYDVTWNRLQTDLKELDDGKETYSQNHPEKLIIFGTNRFLKSALTIKNTTNATFAVIGNSAALNQSVYNKYLSEIPSARAVVFAACHHTEYLEEGNADIYVLSKSSFLSLALLIRTMREKNFTIPIFVITENVVAFPALNHCASNVCGGELWGMVRSAVAETAYPDIRLLDMSLTKENIAILDFLTRCDAPNYNEYLIYEGKIYTSEMIESVDQDHEPAQRELKIRSVDKVMLKSKLPNNVVRPFFHFLQQSKVGASETPRSHTQVRLFSIVMHDASLYPVTSDLVEHHTTLWPENEENGFQVIALEGIGCIEDQVNDGKERKCQENELKIGFCCPVNVSSVIDIPSAYVFSISALPFYTPGIMTLCVILWNFAEFCKTSTHVVLIVDNETSAHCLILKSMISNQKKTHVTTLSKDSLENSASKLSAHTIVLLTKLNKIHLNSLQNNLSDIKNIVSMDIFVSKALQGWIVHNMKDTHVHIFNPEGMFCMPKLSLAISKVQQWMASIGASLKMQLQNEKCTVRSNPLSLPRPTLPLQAGLSNYVHIPLEVSKTEIFRKDSCYILVGGLTGLGWELLQLMAELGAGYLATFSRRLPSEETKMQINEVQRTHGCRIVPIQVDITNLKQLETAIKQLQTVLTNVDLRGIFHGAGVLNDKLLINMTAEDAETPLLPKILGTWNLHLVTKDMQLDFFVMHSSTVSVLGNTGQCNYAAGNSFQDTLAHYRRSKGLCGQSINWSALALGMATEYKELEQKFRTMGLFYLKREEIRSYFVRAIMTNKPQLIYGIIDWSRFQGHPSVKLYPFKFARILEKYAKTKQEVRVGNSKQTFTMEQLEKLDSQERKKLIEGLIKSVITEILVVEKESLDEETRFVALGIDSMAAMSFTNSVFDATQVRISVVTVLSDNATIGSVTSYILENLNTNTTPDISMTASKQKLFEKVLEGNVTYMQIELLRNYVRNPKNGDLMYQTDFEIKGLALKVNDWRIILNHLKKNPEFRRVYFYNRVKDTFESRLVDYGNATLDLTEVPFDSICNADSVDSRNDTNFDLANDLPIKFQISIQGRKTRIRMFIHGVIGNFRSISMVCRTIASYVEAYVDKVPFPEKDTTDVLPADLVRTTLAPKMYGMQQYWKQQMLKEVQPFTFAKDFEQPLDRCNMYETTLNTPYTVVDTILEYLQKEGESLYNFALAAYILILYERTGKSLVPIYVYTDVSSHVPQLASMVTKTTNAIPVIGDVRNTTTVKEYMNKCCDLFREISEQSAYPFALIKEEMPSDSLRRNIGRHQFLMLNMRNLNQTTQHKYGTVEVVNAFHRTYSYETLLCLVYDLQKKQLKIEFGYNTASLGHVEAAEIPQRMVELMQELVKNNATAMKDILRITFGKHPLSNGISKSYSPLSKANESIRDPHRDRPNQGNEYPSGITTRKGHLTPKSETVIVIREGEFLKQTSQGWDHDVHLTMTNDSSSGELSLQWGGTKRKKPRCVSLNSLREAHVKQINGFYGLLIRMPDRLLVFKTRSRDKATDWLNGMKSAFEMKQKFAAETSPADSGVRL